MAFSDNLREAREKHGYSQKELAKFVGISQQAVFIFEKGRKLPNIITGVELANALGTTAEKLVNGTDDKV